MKSLFYVMIIVTNIIILVSCGKESFKDPEAVGQYTFEILQKLNQTDFEEYRSNFISVDDLRELSQNEQLITDKIKRGMLFRFADELDEVIKHYYDWKIERGEEDQINWSQIEFLDYTYAPGTYHNYGEKDFTGTLKFKFNNKGYEVKISALYDGNGYKIYHISELTGKSLE